MKRIMLFIFVFVPTWLVIMNVGNEVGAQSEPADVGGTSISAISTAANTSADSIASAEAQVIHSLVLRNRNWKTVLNGGYYQISTDSLFHYLGSNLAYGKTWYKYRTTSGGKTYVRTFELKSAPAVPICTALSLVIPALIVAGKAMNGEVTFREDGFKIFAFLGTSYFLGSLCDGLINNQVKSLPLERRSYGEIKTVERRLYKSNQERIKNEYLLPLAVDAAITVLGILIVSD